MVQQAPVELAKICAHWGTAATAVAILLVSLIVRDDFFRDTFRYSLQSAATCLLILGGLIHPVQPQRVFGKIVNSRLVQWTGLASYSIYLAHLTAYKLTQDLLSEVPEVIAIAIRILLGVGIGLLCWIFIELPVEQFNSLSALLPSDIS